MRTVNITAVYPSALTLYLSEITEWISIKVVVYAGCAANVVEQILLLIFSIPC